MPGKKNAKIPKDADSKTKRLLNLNKKAAKKVKK